MTQPSILAVWQKVSLSPMPACRFSAASALASAASTFTAKPFASSCLTQAPQQLQVGDFQTSMEEASAARRCHPKDIRESTNRVRIIMPPA